MKNTLPRAYTRAPQLNSKSAASSLAGLVALSFLATLGAPAAAQSPADTRFLSSATETLDGHVTLPLFRGTSGGQTVYYIITEASDAALASQLGVNYAPALANAAGSSAVQIVNTTSTSNINFPATVDFAPNLTANSPGARGNPGYSPLVQLSNGIVLNASHVRNNSGNHDRVVGINTTSLRVTMDESDGFQGNQPVRYIVTEATEWNVAVAERTTFAPMLADIPSDADANLALMRDGQAGFNNVERQGEGTDSAALDADPLNILEVRPGQSGYSPIWEVEPHRWTTANVNAGTNTRQRDYQTVEGLEPGDVQDEPVFPGAGDVYVNCPVIARRSDSVPPAFTPVLLGGLVTVASSGSTGGNVTATAVVRDQNNDDAEGVLVTVNFNNGPSRSCVTDSGGICRVTEFVTGSRATVNFTNLNRKGHSPGIPVSQTVDPRGDPLQDPSVNF